MPNYPKIINNIPSLDPTAPSGLDATAAAEWERLCALPHLSAADAPLLAEYCRCYSRVLALEIKVDHEGPSIPNIKYKGEMKRNPNSAALNQERQYLTRLRNELGLSPKARKVFGAGMKVAPQGDNPWEQIR